ncbi:hypothetical protein L1N85_06190 [Paenibacillus alkaliterrae]|uniref:hypothetical protein n=1 Tax=Paenibacillus alkaliterrae TaxID=320909 RepID=UPI001F2D133D|nr:hypothetical protein [Paenibacillus alkaliterrae]MCF2938019.1 hypothetical protein [Paenibacillus alkaliterrae]
MFVQDAFTRLYRQLWIVSFPIILDTVSFMAGWYMIGFTGESRLSWRVILEMGMPSVSHLFNTPLLANQIEFLNNAGKPSFAWIAVALIMLLSAYAQGGFISALWNMTERKTATFKSFIRDGRKHWIRFIGLYVMIMLAKIAVTSLLVLLFGIAGTLVSLLFFIVMRVLFIYLEFTMVIDRMSIGAALRQSRRYMKLSGPQTTALILAMFLISGAISVIIHWIWQPVAIVTGIVVYAYLMTAIQLAFIMTLRQAREEDSPGTFV